MGIATFTLKEESFIRNNFDFTGKEKFKKKVDAFYPKFEQEFPKTKRTRSAIVRKINYLHSRNDDEKAYRAAEEIINSGKKRKRGNIDYFESDGQDELFTNPPKGPICNTRSPRVRQNICYRELESETEFSSEGSSTVTSESEESFVTSDSGSEENFSTFNSVIEEVFVRLGTESGKNSFHEEADSPIISSDSGDGRFFKRLRRLSDQVDDEQEIKNDEMWAPLFLLKSAAEKRLSEENN